MELNINENFSDKAKRDIKLVEKAKNGDQKAYAELLKIYQHSIYAILLKMVKDKVEAEDLTMEAFGKAFRNLDQYKPTHAFSTWLFRIATNTGIDFLRKKNINLRYSILLESDKTGEEAEENMPSIDLPSNDPDPEEYFINKQSEKFIKDLIKELHPDYKNVLKLRIEDGLQYKEIAEVLNIPLGTVKARLFRAKELIMATIRDKNIHFDSLQKKRKTSQADIIKKYFKLTSSQYEMFHKLGGIYKNLNSKINVISRKDIDQIYLRHILHSLAIAKIFDFEDNTHILDVGTGGGFPGIPLAIMFPNAQFHLIDSIKKKIYVVNEVISQLQLGNVTTQHIKSTNLKSKFDFVVSRAVSDFPKFYAMVKHNIKQTDKDKGIANGIIYLKGGDFSNEINMFKDKIQIFDINDFFFEDFFETKKIIYLPFN